MGQLAARLDAEAAEVFATADRVLGFGLADLIVAGPAEALQPTPIQQPAILTASVASFVALRNLRLLPDAAFVAGHSLGEYAALVAAGALAFEDALVLVRRRGELMQEHGTGAMAAIIDLAPDVVAELAAETGAEVANYNSPEQTTVSGRPDAVERAMTLARERGAKRAIGLPVSGAFHSTLMAPAAVGMRPLIAEATIRAARMPLVTNVGALPIAEPDDIRRELVDQICGSVRWVDTIRWLHAAGVTTYYEVGPGNVLAGLIARIDRGAAVYSADRLLQTAESKEGERNG